MQLYPDYYYDFVLKSGEKSLNQVQTMALSLLSDVLNRRGFRQEFDEFALDIKNEVIDSWVGILENTENHRDVVKLVMSDMQERSGWDSVFDDIDVDTLEEMEDSLLAKLIDIRDSWGK